MKKLILVLAVLAAVGVVGFLMRRSTSTTSSAE
jgi:hypothetical protein